MRLRNKRTGDVWEFDEGFSMKASQETAERAGAISGSLACFANSLAELNEEWEDYEPRINDEDARDAVYSWASALGVHQVRCTKTTGGFGVEVVTFEVLSLGSAPRIAFTSRCLDADVADGATYTIAELCGEE